MRAELPPRRALKRFRMGNVRMRGHASGKLLKSRQRAQMFFSVKELKREEKKCVTPDLLRGLIAAAEISHRVDRE